MRWIALLVLISEGRIECFVCWQRVYRERFKVKDRGRVFDGRGHGMNLKGVDLIKEKGVFFS